MNLILLLLALVILAHASSFAEQPTITDSPIGFSWDDSHEQIIISHISGRISFLSNPERPESSEESYVDFGTHSAAPKSPGPRTKPEHQCHAQAFRKDVTGQGTLWRIESFANDPVLVGYNVEQLLQGKLLRAISHGPVQLPKARYTDVAVSSSGIVFIVDSRGGILQGSFKSADEQNAEKEILKLVQTTLSDEKEGTRSIVYHERARRLVVGTRENGNLVRVDPKTGLRQSISLLPGRLPTSPSSDPQRAMALMFLRDGHLGVLSAGSVYLLQENDWTQPRWSQLTVIDAFDVGSEAVFLSHTSTDCNIFVLSDLRTTVMPDNGFPYSIRKLNVPTYNDASFSRPYLQLSDTIPIQNRHRYSQRVGISVVRSSNLLSSNDTSYGSTVAQHNAKTVSEIGAFVGLSFIRSKRRFISSDADGSIVVYNAKSFSEVAVFFCKSSKGDIDVKTQSVDEFSNILWRIEHWTEYDSRYKWKVVVLVSYDLNILETHKFHQTLKPSGVYEFGISRLHFGLTNLFATTDGSIFASSNNGDIVKIELHNVHVRTIQLSGGASFDVKSASLVTVSRLQPDWQYHDAVMCHDSGLLLIPVADLKGFVRIDIGTGRWQSISIAKSSRLFEKLARSTFWEMVLLRDGRLMLGSCNDFYLLEEVPVPTNERWMQIRIVATVNPFSVRGTRRYCPSICLTPRDNEIAFFVPKHDGNIKARRLLVE